MNNEDDCTDERAEDKQGRASGIWDIRAQVGMLHTVNVLLTINIREVLSTKSLTIWDRQYAKPMRSPQVWQMSRPNWWSDQIWAKAAQR